MNADTVHFYMLAVSLNQDANKIKARFSDYHSRYYQNNGLSITSFILDDKTQIIQIKEFKDKNEANAYFNALQKDKDLLAEMDPAQFHHFLISARNHGVLFTDKNLGIYMSFFAKNYK
jgi:hypothetical protein